MTIPPVVFAAYPPDVRGCSWQALPSGGGMSGGRVWRGERHGNPCFALKRWPQSFNPLRMQAVHDRVRAVADLHFMPRPVPTLAGRTFLVHAGHCWDLSGWMTGTPDLLDRPSPAHLAAAGRALAELHRRWLPAGVEFGPCAAVARRLALFAEWERAHFAFAARPDDQAEMEGTLALVRSRLPGARDDLHRLASLRERVVGVHGDYWPENLLFQRDHLTAVLDFGNVGADHPEVDLGRLFADVPGADPPLITTAVEAYNANAPFDLSAPRVGVLASTGRLGSLANWHLRLTAGSQDAHLLAAALPRVRRLAALIRADSLLATG